MHLAFNKRAKTNRRKVRLRLTQLLEDETAPKLYTTEAASEAAVRSVINAYVTQWGEMRVCIINVEVKWR